MGEHEEWQQPNGLVLNGLLADESTLVIRALDVERWSKAEERISELIACIQPDQPSEQRRNAVADYVQRLIMKCFPCQVFTFGSVPLKTYLPDGDIDLTAFSKNQALKDSWASQVRDILEREEKNENAEFHVKEVQYIQAEVKIVKCLVENIVVDISFNQLGGLCTLCFLEEVDHLINQNHLFKRSVILIKAWCYYESRILGAHHGLISTYALETLVLYIFHVYNNSFSGPLEVLYRFLEFFSKFDWDSFCLSLWGPVPITSLPDITAEPPRQDRGELLLSKLFLDACSAVYTALPIGQENQGHPFMSKHFNVIDPLRVNNNLGRSVSKGNFYRIRSAFAFGAKRLARLLECPKEDIILELNQFFMNTWERHGSGIRPDAPINDAHLRPSDQEHASDNHRKASTGNQTDENASIHEIEVDDGENTHSLSSQLAKSYDVPAVSRLQRQKSSGNQNNSRMSEHTKNHNSNQSVQMDGSQKSWKPGHMDNLQGKYYFARTRSSPELTDAYCDASTRVRRKPADSGKAQVASSKMDASRRRNMASETQSTQSTVSSDDPSSGRHSSSHQQLEVTGDTNSVANSCVGDSVTSIINEDHASVMGAQGMLQEEQDLVNMMASSSVHNFGGPIPMPMNLPTSHLPLPMPQSALASLGYAQRSMAGMVPANIPLLDPHWVNSVQFHQGLMPPSLTQYFPGVGLSTSSEDSIDQFNENFSSVESTCQDADSEYWHERDAASNGGFILNESSLETSSHADDRQPSKSNGANFVSSFRMPVSGGSQKASQKLTTENRGSTRTDIVETFQHQENQVNEVYNDERVSSARFSSASPSGSARMKPSSEGSRDVSSGRVSKSSRDKRGRKPISSSGKGKDVYERTTAEADDESSEWNAASTTGNEIDERSTVSQPTSNLYVSRHHFPGLEGSHTGAPDSVIPIAPMVLGPGSRQRVVDNSGTVPFTFYPTGPPVPFFTMLHYYPSESGTSDPSSSHLGRGVGVEDDSCGQNFEASEGGDAHDTYDSMRRATVTKLSEEPKRDILNSDFASHWQNLQYGRLCQTRYPAPVIYPSPVAVPPMYLQGHFPWDGPGRPVAAKVNILSQLMNYSPQIVPIAPLQSASNRPSTVYQQFPDELPRYRSGTGTYLPNPKASARDRYSSGTRRNNHYYDRSDHGEGNWNVAKSRAASRNHNRSQTDKSRIDRLAASENRADRPWAAHRHDPLPPYQAQNSPIRPSSSQTSSPNVAYGMYQVPGMNPSRVTSNGFAGPPVVMLYPYDNNSGYVSPGEQLEFGSLGPVAYVGPPDGSQSIDTTRVRGEIQRFHGNSAQQSSSDQPSSPHFQRRM